MHYNSTISYEDFITKLEVFQNEYKNLVNKNFNIITISESNQEEVSKKEPKRSFYDILFEPKYDSVLDFFQGKQK